ncbi:stalk domain-containing protein [Paenibacillus sp. FA6]|uniref:stalk domain-containing protein n=1 Tax=Paenibacillus sp. FA6 TaxID=3413029 RepID=UPI003F65546E
MKKHYISITCAFVLLASAFITTESVVDAQVSVTSKTTNDSVTTVNAKGNAVAYAAQNVNQPWGITAASDDSIIIVQSGSGQVSKWTNGKLVSIAGQDQSGYFDGIASKAAFSQPTFTVVDSKGTIYVSDTDNHVIRKVKDGKVYTLAGNGTAGYKDGKLGEAQFNAPGGLSVDAKDNLYVADTLNHVIRKITPEGIVTTYAGVTGQTGGYQDGLLAGARFNEPMGLVFDEKGKLYIADSGNQLIRLIDGDTVETFAGKLTEVDPITGYMAGGYRNGEKAEALFNRPRGLAYKDGVLFIADSLNHRVRAVQPDGRVLNIAGQSKPGNGTGAVEEAMFNQPSALAFVAGKLYVSDTMNNSVKILNVNPKALQSVRSEEDLLDATELSPTGDDMQVWLDGRQILFPPTTKPFQNVDGIYIPVRTMFDSLGAQVKWFEVSKEVRVAKDDWNLDLKLNTDQDILLLHGSMYVEISHLRKVDSLLLAYDEESRAIVIDSGAF